MSKADLEDRFWNKVRIGDGCWEWTGNRTRTGHGYFWRDGRNQIASRVVWEMERGPIPDGLWVLHDCPGGDNPSCVRPGHLRLGTHQDNVDDMCRKGRQRSCQGESAARAKLTADTVRQIRAKRADGESLRVIAAAFGVNFSAVWKVVRGLTWRHVV